MFDPAKLISLVSTRAAAGIAVAVVATGLGGAAVLTTTPVAHHGQDQTVLTVNSTNSSDDSTSTGSNSEDSDTSTNHSSTGSGSTTNHGDVVTAAVTSCKSSAAAAGTHGIGPCVSKVASSNGQTHRHTTSTTTSATTH